MVTVPGSFDVRGPPESGFGEPRLPTARVNAGRPMSSNGQRPYGCQLKPPAIPAAATTTNLPITLRRLRGDRGTAMSARVDTCRAYLGARCLPVSCCGRPE